MLPAGYIRDPDDRVCKVVHSKDDGEQDDMLPISIYPMVNPWLSETALHFQAKMERGWKSIDIDFEVVNSQAEMRKSLQLQRYMLLGGPNTTTNLGNFFVSWIKTLQDTRESVNTSPMGWTHKASVLEGFVYNNICYTPTLQRASASVDRGLDKIYGPVGDLDVWKRAAKLVTDQKRPSLDILLASAFAAPLVEFSGALGVVLTAYSKESGVGKSTALEVAQAVWADYTRAKQGLEDTNNGVMGKLGKIKNLPMYWDEIKSEEQVKEFIKIVFQITSGREKLRMRQNTSLREGGTWKTLLVSANNDSLLDRITQKLTTTDAGLYRVFEVIVPHFGNPTGPGRISSSEAGRLTVSLKYNYGQAGAIYSKFLGENFVKVDSDVEQMLKALEKDFQTKTEERFWTATAAVLLLGAKYANELGLTEIDLQAMKECLRETLLRMRGVITGQMVNMAEAINLTSIMTQFFNEQEAQHTIYTNKTWVGHARPPKDHIKVDFTFDGSYPRRIEGVVVHYSKDDETCSFSRYQFVHWLRTNNLSPEIIVREMERQWGLTSIQGTLGAGVKIGSKGAEWLYRLDLSRCRALNPWASLA